MLIHCGGRLPAAVALGTPILVPNLLFLCWFPRYNLALSFDRPTLFSLRSLLQTEQGEVGWANVWKSQGGAVRSLTNIYCLVKTQEKKVDTPLPHSCVGALAPPW